MYEINKDVVYVQGHKNGAIYDFNTKKVFWVNHNSGGIINKLVKGEILKNIEEKQYVQELIKHKLYNDDFIISKYNIKNTEILNLEMVWLEITQSCNCKCLHCYQGETHITNNNALSLDNWKEIIIQIKALNVKRVVVIGGEPCVHPYINEIIKFLADNQINTTLFTNATIISDELEDIIVRNSKYIRVKMSLYGHNAEVHDHISQTRGSFNKLENAIHFFKSNNVDVNVAVVLMKENQNYVDEIKEYIDSLEIVVDKFDVIRNVYGGNQDEHTPDRIDILEQSKYSRPQFFAIKSRFQDNCIKNSCWHGKFAITELGDVLPCVFERNIIYGNTKKSSLTEILNSEKLKSSWYLDFSNIKYCKDCEFRFACRDCRPLGMSKDNDLTAKNPRCMYNPYTGEWENNDGA